MDSKKSCRLSVVSGQWSRGATIVEISVAISLIGLISLLIAVVYFAHFKLFSNQVTGIDVSSQNKLALEKITNQIRESQSVAECPNPTGDCPADNILVLKLWRLDPNQEPNSTAFDYIVYKKDSTDASILRQIIEADSTSSRTDSSKIISTYLAADGLQFTYDNADKSQATEVTVRVITSGQYGDKIQTVDQSSKAVLRNK